MLPTDFDMLIGYCNMKLRDFYPSLEALCDGEDIGQEELLERFRAHGYEYDPQTNRFVSR